jgi:hypothetical protein
MEFNILSYYVCYISTQVTEEQRFRNFIFFGQALTKTENGNQLCK